MRLNWEGQMKLRRCDRSQFIDGVNGDLMTNIGGKITQLGDAAMWAVEAAEDGEDIVLTVDGRPSSIIHHGDETLLTEGADFVEEE